MPRSEYGRDIRGTLSLLQEQMMETHMLGGIDSLLSYASGQRCEQGLRLLEV